MICGLTAKTTASGATASGNSTGERCQETAGSVARAGGGPAGSTTSKRAAALLATQPRNKAVPILPHPTSTTLCGANRSWTSRRSSSGLAERIDHRRGDRFERAFAAPQHELKCGIKAFAFRQRDVDEIFDLLGAAGADPAQQRGVAKGRRAVFARQVEMAEPQLFVGQRQQLIDRTAPTLRHLHVKAARKVHRAQLFLPDKIKAVITPAAGNFGDQLLFAGPVMRPVVRVGDFFDKINRIAEIGGRFGCDNGGHQKRSLTRREQLFQEGRPSAGGSPGAGSAAVEPAAASVGTAAAPASFSRAASRFASSSCSVRALAAIALTASNSSRVTRSMPAMTRSS